MKELFDYRCKNCWHNWRSEKTYNVCPKCQSTYIDFIKVICHYDI